MSFPHFLLQGYLDRLCNRPDVYAIQVVEGDDYRYEPIREPVTLRVIAGHLLGDITVGFYGLSLEHTSKWLCIDFDYKSDDASRLCQLFMAHGWHCYVEGKRTARDGHVWLFFDEPVPAIYLRRFAREFLRSANIAASKVEIFPKQDRLHSDDGLGNLMRGPLGIHRKPGANNERGWFEDAPRTILEQLKWFHAQRPNRAFDLLSFTQKLEAMELITKATSKGSRSALKATRTKPPSGRIDWIEYATTNGFQFSNRFWHGPCPVCKLIGHDSDDNHLNISETGAVNCWRGCSFQNILVAARGCN